MINLKLMAFFVIYFLSGFSYAKEVKNIEFLKYGIAYEGRSKVEQEGCALFRPTKEQLVEFFEKARELEYGGSIAHQYYSPCIATGTVSFKDGTSGRWSIQSSGYGYATLNNNKPMDFFYKDNKWYDPFECTYAMGDESEPGCD
ncbi:hypothetical protein [Pseudomonas graminis]